jgi:regulator of sigma E protease
MELLQWAITIVLFLLILGALVLIHEVGHFVVARMARIRVHEFGIGFPPRAMVLRSEGETLYTLNWLPIGGFVRLEGEDGDSDDPRSFIRARFATKQVVLVAGVVMNLLLAFVIFTGIAWLANPTTVWTVGSVQAGSPAASVGLVPGDGIVSLEGHRYDAFEGRSLISDLQASAGRTVTLGVERASGGLEELTVRLRTPEEIKLQPGALGISSIEVSASGPRVERGLGEAVAVGAARTVQAFRFILDGLGQLAYQIVTQPTEPPPAAGPIGIAQEIGRIFWEEGLIPTLQIAGILSANLALVNILPFPPLDGGRMLFLVIKAVAGARVSIRAERLTYIVGFLFLFGFLIWISAFDIARLGGIVP